MSWRPLLALSAVLLIACGSAAPPRASLGGPAHPPMIRADEPVGAGVPAPTPTPAPYVPLDGLRILIPALGINLKIVEGDGAEPHYGFADHYPGMKWPGQGGRSFIYAHAQPGMFGPLLGNGYASVGDEVDIQQPDGSQLRYKIDRYTNKWPVTDTSILAPTNHEELILYTCTSWTYADPKIVAWAEPI
jgi:hypothetical protein